MTPNPLKGAASGPLDVAAGIFQKRIYLASRWPPVNTLAVDFSEDGENWSGWRVPVSDVDVDGFQVAATATLAPLGNHLYLLAAEPAASSAWAN